MESTQTGDASVRLGGEKGPKLTLVDAVAQSVGFMGPVFSMAFLVPLVVGIISVTGNGAGIAAPLSVLIAAIGVLAIAWIVAQYAKRIHAAGALYDYVSDGLGSKIGAAAGFLYYVGLLFLGAGILVLIAGTIHDTLAAEFGFEALSTQVWAILLLALVVATMFFGVALSTRTQLVLALLGIATVLLFALHVIVQVGADNKVGEAFSPSSAPNGWAGIAFGIVYGVLLFTGFETSANLGEETSNPKRDIPRAVIGSVVIVGLFYLLVTYAQIAGYGFNLDAIGTNAGAPLFGLAAPSDAGGYGSVLIGRWLELVVVLDMIAVLLGISVAASRGIFAMARDHRFPSTFSQVSRRGTPFNAGIAVVVFYLVFAVLTFTQESLLAILGPDGEPAFPHYFSMFSWASAFGGLALAVIYFLLCLGGIRGLRDANPALKWVAVIVGLLVTAAAIFGGVYQVQAPTLYSVYAIVVVLVIGLILAFVIPGKPADLTTFDELTSSEQGPQKL